MSFEVERYRGTGVALVTPFGEDGGVDHDGLRRHVEMVMEGGVEFLVPCGTTGEVATQTREERVEVVRTVVEAAGGRVPVMAGVSSNATADAAAQARAAREAGADALLVVTPYYNKPPQEGMVRHFETVADAGELPVCLYNVPGRTGANLLPETALRLAEHEAIFAIKEASGDLGQVMELIAHHPDGFLVLSGEDDLTLPLVALGGDGVISVVANEAPGPFSDMVRAALAGDLESARAGHYRLLELMRVNFVQTNPIPVKAAVALLGGPDARVRAPLVPASPTTLERLRDALVEAALLEEAASATVSAGADVADTRSPTAHPGGAS